MKLHTTLDGSHTLTSPQFNEMYHSKHGAIQESQTVFINEGLLKKVGVKKKIRVLEMGFGTGLNAFMTLLEAEKNNLTIEYVGLEKYPISIETATTINYPHQLNAENHHPTFLKLHTTDWGVNHQVTPNFSFKKLQIDINEFKPENLFDVVYYDAFAPAAQPELWSEDLMKKIYAWLNDGGILTTYCAKGSFKRALKGAGFTVENPPGPIGKREMTRGVK